ncbi:class I SAM-dependent RNA methyltransferase [Ornithinimicrobium ciconiae]|uniref:Class I SAM-dependent RNA methyltransferase n=1 Tax=Ornithinimicrobium ciconiae TaxID=2594265 RepID=A0A516GAE0_9MICO|nr:TRAM domain-containing protein [Ornithinimicrobium ciconiae]QDO88472.1 class I SAM-dependent RNA methyltransferase [Ornithinimicrobium ciconiae]
MTAGADELVVGASVEVEVGPVAHGGHCVARHHGQVLFVRHTLPGERVRAVVTEIGPRGRFLRADAVEVLEAAPGRVERPCPWSGPGLCGGCDWQHVDLTAQRALKRAVILEQFSRLADLDLTAHLGREVEVEAVPGDRDGLGWRTRVEFAVDQDGRPGLRRHRSHDIVPVDTCLIADPRVLGTGVLETIHPGSTAVDVIVPSVGEPVVVEVPDGPVPVVRERVALSALTPPVGDLELEVSARGFWQVHPGAARTFVSTVLDWLAPQPGERALDLYAGVGVFAAALARRVGPQGMVTAIEGDRVATEHARDNLAASGWVEVVRDRVDRATRRLVRAGSTVDLVVLDPPRTGAGRQVCRDLAALRPRAIGYVACDPAALARDVGYLAEQGYTLTDLRAFDAFPMTHHMELVAVLHPTP